jgi:hypothetical protein
VTAVGNGEPPPEVHQYWRAVGGAHNHAEYLGDGEFSPSRPCRAWGIVGLAEIAGRDGYGQSFGGIVNFVGRHRAAVASGTVLLVASSVLVAVALTYDGNQVHRPELNDGGVWVTNGAVGMYGRMNAPINQLDGGFYAPQTTAGDHASLDVLQQDAAVYGWNRDVGTLTPIDVTTMNADDDAKAKVPPSGQVGLGGGTLAALEAKSGRIRLGVVDPATGAGPLNDVDFTAKPAATAGGDAALAVGVDGTVFAVSAQAHALTAIHRSGAGFAAAVTSPLPVTGAALQVTAVGDRPVVLDQQAGEVVLPGGGRTRLPAKDARLQQPGPAAGSVLVATGSALLSVPLGGGDPVTLVDDVGGAPIAPVRLGACAHAAWLVGGRMTVGRACDGSAPSTAGIGVTGNDVDDWVFRVNRGQIRLNNRDSGAVYNIDDKPVRIDNWAAVQPPQSEKPKKGTDEQAGQSRKPPTAKADDLGARPGRTTVLHVLDNDSVPDGRVLNIDHIVPPDEPGVTVRRSPDAQTIEVSLPDGAADVIRFRYGIDDGVSTSKQDAQVTVHPHGPDVNGAPTLRQRPTTAVRKVAASSQATIPVVGDWRDPDGDPVVLVAATAGTDGGAAGTTPDGAIVYNSPPTRGALTLRYTVADGLTDRAGRPSQATGTVPVEVLDPKSEKVEPPVAQPDVVIATAGRPTTVHPLDNDQAGADPTSDGAHLQLGSPLAQPAGITVQTDLAAGAVTIVPQSLRKYSLPYNVSYGAGSAKGTIRVVVEPAPTKPQDPNVMPDTAVLRGQQPVVVDVLANDYDPSGGVLVVQRAEAAGGGRAGLRAAIIDGHWLRIDATTAAGQSGGQPELVRYTVGNGQRTATGEVSVTRLPAPARNSRPVPQDDLADARVGDAVTVPVLENDLDPDGDMLKPLAAEVTTVDAAGKAAGVAYVAGNVVHYAAPTALTDLTAVDISYTVQDPAGATASARITVTVHPAAESNAPPVPAPVTTSAVSGDTITIRPPTTGVDPNGDSVAVTGLASNPALGRVLAVTATSLVYQAFPESSGTDSFSYEVIDRYGATGTATVRVGVQEPADPQPPVAVDDVVRVAPGRALAVDVEGNDFIAHGDGSSTALSLVSAPAGVQATGPVVQLTGPAADGNPVVVPYKLDDGLASSTATLTVRGVAGFDNPPVARDDDARTTEPKAATATVDVLANDDDPDGPTSGLTVTAVGPGGVVSGGKVTVTLTKYPQTIWYRVQDKDGGAALASIHAPSTGNGRPYVKDGALIRVDSGKSVEVAVGDYLVDPAGKPLIITLPKRVWPAPAGSITATSKGTNRLTVSGVGAYVGPAAVTLEVTDGATVDDPAGTAAVVTIPVQVGPDTPVLHCPDTAFGVVQGGRPLDVSLPAVCHVWVPSTLPIGDVGFTASWKTPLDQVSQQVNGQKLRVQAAGAARPGTSGVVEVRAKGSNKPPQTLRFSVLEAPAPTVRPITVDGLKVTQTRTVDIAPYLSSPLVDAAPTVLSATHTAGAPGTATVRGSTVTVTPADSANGDIVFTLSLTDQPGQPRRQIQGTVTVHVLGHPADVQRPTADANRTAGHQVRVAWPAPAEDGGAPIDVYRVTWAGGTHSCPASPCVITGLKNGIPFSFAVEAHNIAGFWSKQKSPTSNPVTPDARPGPTNGVHVVTVGDRQLRLAWTTNVPDGSPADQYEVEIKDVGSTTPGTTTQKASVPGLVASGLTNNDAYEFRVRAHNGDGWGPYGSSVGGQSAGTPAAMVAPTVPAETTTAPSNNTAADVTWSPEPDPNGPPVTHYTVYRKAGGAYTALDNCRQVDPAATMRCLDTVTNDGTHYTYAVTATNGGDLESAPVNGTEFVATGKPDQISAVTARASDNPGAGPQTDSGPGYNGAVKVIFTVPQPHGGSITRIKYTVNGSERSWAGPFTPGAPTTQDVGGLSNGSGYSIAVYACNEGNTGAENCGDASPASNTVYPYGPPLPYSVSATNSGNVVTYSWNGGYNGRDLTYFVNIDGGGYQARGAGSEAHDRGYSYNYSLDVYVRDTAGQQTGPVHAGGRTPDNPPTISASQGASGWSTIGSCPGPGSGCNWLAFQVHNFPLGQYTWRCISNGGVSYSSSATVNVTNPNQSFSGGSTSNGYCVFGHGITEQIEFNGVTSNAVTHSP